MLTEKIYQFERECERLKAKKRQIVLQQQKVNQSIQDRFAELETRQLKLIDLKDKLKQKYTGEKAKLAKTQANQILRVY